MFHRKYLRCQQICTCILIGEIMLFMICTNIKQQNEKSIKKSSYLIHNEGCKIPEMQIKDEEIMSLLADLEPYSCSDKPPLIESNSTAVFVNESVFSYYGISHIDEVKCSYRTFERVKPTENEDDNKVKYNRPVRFRSSVDIASSDGRQFVRVRCRHGATKHVDYHSFVPFVNKTTRVHLTARDPNDEHLNVIMIGIDSLSRLHFHRKMPETLDFLLNKLDAIEYLGYNKLADNTFANLLPMFTNYKYEELTNTCWPSSRSKFDNCSFVWTNYSDLGYFTYFAEENSREGLFNYQKAGWFDQPTDYYWNTFDRAALDGAGHSFDKADKYPRCMGPRPMYKVLLSSTEKFISTMKDYKFFMFSWDTTLTHDHADTAALGDGDYAKHLKFLNDSGILNISLVIFLSDHGFRFGPLSRTRQGHLENRLPYIYWILPAWFRTKHKLAVHNLKENRLKLTTPFDVFATLNHILHTDQLSDRSINERRGRGVLNERSISLFDAVPSGRSCGSADIPAHWCTCVAALPVAKTNRTVVDIASFVVRHLNALLSSRSSVCARLTLDEVTAASVASVDDGRGERAYTVSLKTAPGRGWFHATVTCVFCTHDFTVAGTVGRLNRYDAQSDCIRDFQLKLYCYCKNQTL